MSASRHWKTIQPRRVQELNDILEKQFLWELLGTQSQSGLARKSAPLNIMKTLWSRSIESESVGVDQWKPYPDLAIHLEDLMFVIRQILKDVARHVAFRLLLR